MGVEYGLRDLPHAVERGARALFDSQGVVGGFELDEGALADRAGVDVRFEVQGRGRVDPLSPENFSRAADLWNKPGREAEKPYFGWLTTDLPPDRVCRSGTAGPGDTVASTGAPAPYRRARRRPKGPPPGRRIRAPGSRYARRALGPRHISAGGLFYD
ncbi:hypothetical protein GCM10010431_33680 [Streptomyces kunmingensis]